MSNLVIVTTAVIDAGIATVVNVAWLRTTAGTVAAS